jgi:hypothetical protein
MGNVIEFKRLKGERNQKDKMPKRGYCCGSKRLPCPSKTTSLPTLSHVAVFVCFCKRCVKKAIEVDRHTINRAVSCRVVYGPFGSARVL